jgi:hypothetical protein
MRKFNKGLDEQMLEGGRGSGGGGGMSRAMEKYGPMGLLVGSGAAGYADYKSTKNRQREEREAAAAAAEMKRGKTSEDRAREAAAEEAMQRKVNKAAEDASKDMGFKKGGMTASKRADGCATKGKTKGTMITMKGGGYAC